MAVNIYVGPLVRFYSGDWKPVFMRGINVQSDEAKHRPPFANEKVSPIEIRNYIIEWRKQISYALKKPLTWAETPDTPYHTNSIDRGGYDALRLWAAYTEQTNLPKPADLPDDVDNDPILISSEAKNKSEFSQIIGGVVIWLPLGFGVVFEADFLHYDEPVSIGSSGALFDQLKKLNEKTWKASPGEIASWRESEKADNNLLEPSAKFGFSVFYNLAQLSVMHHLPMALYY